VYFVVCEYCLSLNLPVLLVTAQSECIQCKKIAYRYENTPFITCSCGAEMDILRCQTCTIQYVTLREEADAINCPQCGELLSFDSKTCISTTEGNQKVVSSFIFSEVNIPLKSEMVKGKKVISLIIDYYKDSSRERQMELDMCLINNISNIYIDQIHVLFSSGGNDSEAWKTLQELNLGPKVSCHLLFNQTASSTKHLRYRDALTFASKYLAGHVCILANSDVYFDYTLRRLYEHELNNVVLALSRHDVRPNGLIIFNQTYAPVSQDAWIFRSPVAVQKMSCDFEMGRLGCDNRISYEFTKAGHKVLNPCIPSSGIIVRHLHQSEKRNYSKSDKIKGEYLCVFPSEHFS